MDEALTTSVSANLSLSGQAGSSYYLRAEFASVNPSSSYFGYTLNNAGVWYNGTPTPIDHTKYYKVTLDQNNSWSGTLNIKLDLASSAYKGTGTYNFKVARYTSGGSLTQSDNILTVVITKSQIFSFQSGNNLVGLTINSSGATPSAYLAENFLKDLNKSFVPASSTKPVPNGDKITQVARYYNGNFQIHLLNSPEDNFSIVPGEGYFVYSSWPGRSTLSGGTITSTSIKIPRLRSIISFPNAMSGINDVSQLAQKMKDQSIDVRKITRWYGGKYVTYDVSASGANNFPINPGEGYFIANYGSEKNFTLP